MLLATKTLLLGHILQRLNPHNPTHPYTARYIPLRTLRVTRSRPAPVVVLPASVVVATSGVVVLSCTWFRVRVFGSKGLGLGFGFGCRFQGWFQRLGLGGLSFKVLGSRASRSCMVLGRGCLDVQGNQNTDGTLRRALV